MEDNGNVQVSLIVQSKERKDIQERNLACKIFISSEVKDRTQLDRQIPD